MKTNTYNIIIAGAGLSGLSLAYHLAKSGYSGSVLLVDKSFAPSYRKTWGFFAKEIPPFYNLVYKRWRKTFFSALDFDAFLYMNKYSYYCIRESDYKEYILTELRKYSNFDLLEEGILDFSTSKKKVVMLTKNSDTYVADYIFQSIFRTAETNHEDQKPAIAQHFYGMEIRTRQTKFDPSTFTIMEVDKELENGFGAFFALPFKHNTVLVKYVHYSGEVMKKKVYRRKIRKHLKAKFGLKRSDYEVVRREKGKIFTSDYEFSPMLDTNIFNIGRAGGLTKACFRDSFLRVHRYTKQLAASLVDDGAPDISSPFKPRFQFYDRLLTQIMAQSPENYNLMFYHLFKNNKIDQLFEFLNEESTLGTELKILKSLPNNMLFRALSKKSGNQ